MGEEVDYSIAYICDGLDPKCSGKVGCFKSLCSTAECNHTLNERYALNGPCEDPENHPERFTFIDIPGEKTYWEGAIDIP